MTTTRPVSDLYVEAWGDGTPVVLVHGSLATGAEEWEAQRPLAGQGFRLLGEVGRWFGGCVVLRAQGFRFIAHPVRASRPRQRPPIEPCVRFSRTRLSDTVHRQACTALHRRTLPVSR